MKYFTTNWIVKRGILEKQSNENESQKPKTRPMFSWLQEIFSEHEITSSTHFRGENEQPDEGTVSQFSKKQTTRKPFEENPFPMFAYKK